MDLIIRAIIAIFEAIFEEDAKKRRPTQDPQARGKPQTLEEYKAELRRQEHAAKKKQKAAHQEKQKVARANNPIPASVEARVQTTFEHVPDDAFHPADHTFLVDFDPDSIHHLTKSKPKEIKAFQVPGKTEFEKLILAQAILGPCKAHQKMGLSRRI
ncbi:MAG: hypothetical protein H6510_01555 [Acidobacteria bacterium]|nr:hypothetical protein [Acidobacteriota bacterium]MCB9396476.1 hypothetical protein [Acidobacteriota bacterium]